MAAKKITIEELATILSASVEGEAEKQRILAEARNYLSSQGDAGPVVSPPQPETRDVTIIVGAEDTIALIDTDSISAFTVKIDATFDHNGLIPRLMQRAAVYNESVRRGRPRIETLGEAFALLSPKKHLEGSPKKILNKHPALVLTTTNLSVVAAPR